MTRKNRHSTRHSANSAAQAEREFARLRRAMREAERDLSGLRRSLKVPRPHGGRRYTASVRTRPSLLASAGISAVGSSVARGITGRGGVFDSLFGGGDFDEGSFYLSLSQSLSQFFNISRMAQRIR
ncbi:MAG: hypothetical protein SFW62_03590 [Alphaproteobacteria bacterium]|nr:hypothetical protein [Alphaproteobacteria bacterium]